MDKVIFSSLKKYRFHIFIFTILIILNTYLLTIPAKIIGNMIDLLYNIEQNKQEIINNIYYLLGTSVIFIVVRLAWKYLETFINRSCERDIKIKVFQRFLKLKLKDIQGIKNGEIMSYFVKDINEIRLSIWRILSHGLRVIFIFIIAAYQMAKGVNIELTIAVIIPMVVGLILMIKIKKYIEKSFKKAQNRFTDLSEYIQESTDSIRTTKAYGCEGEQLKTFIRKNKLVRQSNNTVDIYSNLLTSVLGISFGLCYAISILYGSKLVINGTISVGDLITFNGYIGLFINPINWIPGIITRLKRAEISYERLDKLFKLETEKINTKSNIEKERLIGDIKINNLSFNYPGFLENALNDINLEINKGQTLGIIGTIGSGKTTLMNLLTKLYAVPDGKITIDNVDINDIPIEVLRNNICYITQDNFLFSSTLKDNVSLFKDDYTEDDIKESTKKAIVYEDISRLPDNINTVLGERGNDLSGGQKQRVAISRAFLKNSSILIFDDSFSALDNKTSEKLLENIKSLSNDKTCIIISNKVSDVKNSDIIIVLDNGKIVEKGTHETLLQRNGIYNEFFKQQSTKIEEAII